MKLVLVRHGESIWNKENLFTGWTDVDLSETGEKEAADAGRTLLEQGYDFDLCYTSYLKRAIHTLDHILEEMDRCWLPVDVYKRQASGRYNFPFFIISGLQS